MIKIIQYQQKTEWDRIVVSFERHDVYYLHGYVDAFMLHGDGVPILVYYESPSLRGMYVAMVRDLSSLPCAGSIISAGEWYDMSSPYGYGGWLFQGDASDDNLKVFYKEYRTFMLVHHYVSNFVRYSPVLANAEAMKQFGVVTDLGRTISIDLKSKEVIWKNITSKCRNMIRKAIKNDVVIEHGKPTQHLMATFKRIYDDTMRHDDAIDYYFFDGSFYQSIIDNFTDNTEVFYALKDGEIIAVSIILYGNGQMHYHLSGTDSAYRKLAPTNLLLYEAALWGHEMGFKSFHLGGGLGSGEDNLYKFKKSFNRDCKCQFSIGKEIFNNEMYLQLVNWREQHGMDFDKTSSFFPVYRQGFENLNENVAIMTETNKPNAQETGLKKRRIAIYGAGGLGREVAGGIQRINNAGREQWELVGFYDDGLEKGTQVSHYGTVLGGMDDLNALQEPMALAIAVGSPDSRKLIHERITNDNIFFPNLIAPSFRILDPKTFKIGQGNIIQDNCSVTCDVELGDYNVLNGSNALGHDVRVGSFNVMMPGVRLSGEVKVGDCNLLGVDGVVLQKIKIGNHITLGAGSVLMTKPKDGATYIGVPAKRFNYE